MAIFVRITALVLMIYLTVGAAFAQSWKIMPGSEGLYYKRITTLGDAFNKRTFKLKTYNDPPVIVNDVFVREETYEIIADCQSRKWWMVRYELLDTRGKIHRFNAADDLASAIGSAAAKQSMTSNERKAYCS